MHRAFGAGLRIGVAPGAVALVAVNRFKRGQVNVLAEQRLADGGFDTIAAGVRALLADAGCDGWPATMVIADELARLWQVTPPPGAARMADLEGAAALRFQSLYGEAPSAWRIAADYDPVKPFLAAALPGNLLLQLAAAASAHRLVLLEVVPQFVAACNRWRKQVRPDAWYGLVHDGVLTLHAGGAVRAVALPVSAGPDWLAAQLQREALRLNIAAPQRLMASGAVPASWVDGTLCTRLGDAIGADWSPAVRLAATGSVA